MTFIIDSHLLFASVRIPCTAASVDYASLTATELARACADHTDAAAWHEFIERYQRVIATVVYRVARRWGEDAPAVSDDLVQETYLKLYADRARILGQFQAAHPEAIFGFLKVLAANVANDHFKRLHAGKRGGDFVGPLEDAERTSAVATDDAAAVERGLLLGEVDSYLRAGVTAETRERDCIIFSLYYRHGWTAKEIAALPAIALSVKGVESTLHRLVQLVRNHLVESRSRREIPIAGDTPGEGCSA